MLATAGETRGEMKTDTSFYLETIERINETPATTTSCCGHPIHSQCFWQWLYITATENADDKPCCAYCRAIYVDMLYCFLSLRLKQTNKRLQRTALTNRKIEYFTIKSAKQVKVRKFNTTGTNFIRISVKIIMNSSYLILC